MKKGNNLLEHKKKLQIEIGECISKFIKNTNGGYPNHIDVNVRSQGNTVFIECTISELLITDFTENVVVQSR